MLKTSIVIVIIHLNLNFRWKDAFNETTEKLQSELVHLQSENSRLIAENQKLNRELHKHH